jgi:hypothetical protein
MVRQRDIRIPNDANISHTQVTLIEEHQAHLILPCVLEELANSVTGQDASLDIEGIAGITSVDGCMPCFEIIRQRSLVDVYAMISLTGTMSRTPISMDLTAARAAKGL